MIFRSPWNRKFLPGGEEDRLLCKNDQDACGKNTTTPLKMTNVGIAQALFDPQRRSYPITVCQHSFSSRVFLTENLDLNIYE